MDGFKVATAYVTVEPDTAGFDEKLKAKLEGSDAKAKVKLDGAGKAITELDAVSAKMDEVGAKTAKPNVDSSSAKEGTGWMALLVSTAAAVAPVAITAGLGLAAFGALAIPTLEQAARGTGALKSGVGELKIEYGQMAGAVKPEVIRDFNSAVYQGVNILPEFSGAAMAGGNALGGFIGQFGDFLQSGVTTQFLSFIEDQAAPDLHSVGNLLTGASGAVFGLTQALNPLGKALVNTAGGALTFVGDVSRAVPLLPELAAGGTIAYVAFSKLSAAWKKFAEGSAGKAILGSSATLAEFSANATLAAAAQGILAESSDPLVAAWLAETGAAEALTFAIGEMTAADVAAATASAALDVVAPWLWVAAGAAALGGLIYVATKAKGNLTGLESQLAASSDAAGYNVAGYNNLAKALGSYNTYQKAVIADAGMGKYANQQATQALTADQQQVSTSTANLVTGLNSLQRTFGLTRAQAIQAAQGAGVSASAFQKGGSSAEAAGQKVADYLMAGAQASSVTTQLAADWTIAADDADHLAARVTALTNAYDALVSPLTSVVGDTVTWRDDQVSLGTALRKSGDMTGYATAAQRAASQAMATSVTDTLNLSEATLQNSGSAREAEEILQKEITTMEQLGVKGSVATGLLHRLREALAALHSKTLDINVNVLQQGGLGVGLAGRRIHAAGGAIIPGYAPGQDTRTAEVSPGEAILVPELTREIGPDNIMAANRAYSGGRPPGGKTGHYSGGGLVSTFTSAYGLAADQFNIYANVNAAPLPKGVHLTALPGGATSQLTPVEQFRATGEALASAFADGSLKTLAQVKSEASAAITAIRRYYTGAQAQTLIGAITRQATALENIAAKTAAVDKRISTEKSYAANIRSGLTGFSDLSSLAVPTLGGNAAQLGQSLSTQLQAKLADLHQWYALIGKMKDKKVSKALIAQVIAEGPAGGIQLAQAILSGGSKLISELDSEQQQIGTLDTQIGRRATDIQYDQSIGAAFLSGIRSQRNALDREWEHAGETIARTVAKDFDLPLRDVRGLPRHDQHHHGSGTHHGGKKEAANITNNFNYYGTRRPDPAEKAEMMRDLALTLSGT